MQHRKMGNTGLTPSALGFGMMRLPRKEDGKFDQEESTRILRWAIDNGLSYVDTAYIYETSEVVTGNALKDGYREKVTLATKTPVYAFKCEEDFDRILDEQLARLQTDHIDCYLLHALNRETWHDNVLKFNVLEHMKQAKAAGKIRHMGFSFHDNLDVFKEILDGFDGWEFCQIQLNYLDTGYQAGLEGLELAASRGLGVVIMEPLRGGKLAQVPEQVVKIFGDKNPVEAGLDFLWDRPEVSVVLSGMGNEQMVRDNMTYAARSGIHMLTAEDREKYEKAAEFFRSVDSIPCTGCGYCSVCPMDIAIPQVFAAYNRIQLTGNVRGERPAYDALGDRSPDKCVECHACEERCPQHIAIPEELKKVGKLFRGEW